MKLKITIDFDSPVKVFKDNYNIQSEDFYSLEIFPFVGRKQLDKFELLLSNIVDGTILWNNESIDGNRGYSFGKLNIKGLFEQDIPVENHSEFLLALQIKGALTFKSAHVFILVNPDAEEDWGRTRALLYKEEGGWQKLKMSIET